MKRIICVAFCVCLLLSLSACKVDGYDTLKFKKEEDMKAHLQGVWTSGDEEYRLVSDYLVFNGDEVLLFNANNIDDVFDDIIKEKGYEEFKKLTSEKVLEAFEKHIHEKYLSFTADHKKGKLTAEMSLDDGANEVYVLEDGIEFNYDTYEKLSGDTSLASCGFVEIVNKKLGTYMPPLSLFNISIKQYAQAIKALHPEIGTYTLAHEDEDFVMYTDTGRSGEGSYSDVWMYTDSTFLFVDDNRTWTSYKYRINYSNATGEDTILVTGNVSELSTMVRDALAWFNDYPCVLTVDELLDLFEQNAKTEYGGKIMEHTHGVINYQITVSAKDYAVVTVRY